MKTYNNEGLVLETDNLHNELDETIANLVESAESPEELAKLAAGGELSDEQLMAMAKTRVSLKNDLLIHAVVYAASMALFVVLFGFATFVFNIVAAGWFIGIAAHAIWVYTELTKQTAIIREFLRLKHYR
ncbi:MAG: 2TM domain-containing protein [Firmicutes bacterium]|nr:2TM domain-containing protein [Bacillota bacterium]